MLLALFKCATFPRFKQSLVITFSVLTDLKSNKKFIFCKAHFLKCYKIFEIINFRAVIKYRDRYWNGRILLCRKYKILIFLDARIFFILLTIKLMLFIIFKHKYNIVMLRFILVYAFLYIIYLFTYTSSKFLKIKFNSTF